MNSLGFMSDEVDREESPTPPHFLAGKGYSVLLMITEVAALSVVPKSA